MQKKFQADWKHNCSFLLNAPWQNPWSSGPWQNPWMLRFIISMGFAMELWENPLHGKTHISWVLPWYMGFAIDLWQNPWDTLIRPRHAVIAHFEAYVPLFSKHLWNLTIPQKLWVSALFEVGWSRTVVAKIGVFRPLFWRKCFVSSIWPHKHPQVLYMVGKLRIFSTRW